MGLSDSLQSLIPVAKQQESDLAAAQATITSQSGTIGAQQQQIQSLSDQLKATQAERDALNAAAKVARPSISVGTSYVPTGELFSLLNTTTPGALQDNAVAAFGPSQYTVTGTPTIKAKGLRLYAPGARWLVTPDVAHNASSAIVVQGDGNEFAGMTLAANLPNVVAFRLYGVDPKYRAAAPLGTRFTRMTFDGSLGTGINIDAWADNCQVYGCTFGVIGGESIYCTADNLAILASDFAGSQGEHCVRWDINSSTAHVPANGYMWRCNLTNHNPQGKETVTARQLQGLLLECVTSDGWMSFGQAGPVNSGKVYASGIVLRRAQFVSLRPGGALIQLNYNTDLLCEGCTFPASATETAISANGGAKLTLTNNTLLVPAGMTPKPLAAANPAGDTSIVISETGTVRKAA